MSVRSRKEAGSGRNAESDVQFSSGSAHDQDHDRVRPPSRIQRSPDGVFCFPPSWSRKRDSIRLLSRLTATRPLSGNKLLIGRHGLLVNGSSGRFIFTTSYVFVLLMVSEPSSKRLHRGTTDCQGLISDLRNSKTYSSSQGMTQPIRRSKRRAEAAQDASSPIWEKCEIVSTSHSGS
jgi:hypothetical protein